MKGFAPAFLLLAVSATGVGASSRPPASVLDHGACPFECCRYGEWETLRSVGLYEAPGGSGKRVGDLAAGVRVHALTGQVRTRGQPFTVHRPHGRYRRGDTLMVYTYRGEGVFSVRYKGQAFEEQLDFSPYGGTGGKRCTDKRVCWGSLAGELRSQWWAQVRLPDGRLAWVRADQGAFRGQDACG